MKPSMRGDSVGDRSLDLLGIGYVKLVRADLDAIRPDFAGNSFSDFSLTAKANRHRATGTRKFERDSLADTTATAQDQRSTHGKQIDHLILFQ
jgi:hypothetical protein